MPTTVSIEPSLTLESPSGTDALAPHSIGNEPGVPQSVGTASPVVDARTGLPVGGDLDYADELTIGRALIGRTEL